MPADGLKVPVTFIFPLTVAVVDAVTDPLILRPLYVVLAIVVPVPEYSIVPVPGVNVPPTVNGVVAAVKFKV